MAGMRGRSAMAWISLMAVNRVVVGVDGGADFRGVPPPNDGF